MYAKPERWTPSSFVSLAILVTGSLLVGFSMGSWLAPLAAWIGPALILRYARDHKVGRGYLFVLAALILAVFIGFGDFFPPPISIFIVVGNGLLMSLPFLADRLLSPPLRGFSNTFVYPLAATTLELVNIHANPLGAWGATAFTQYGVLELMQLASVTGTIGITFLMAWFASLANWVWENRGQFGGILRGLSTYGTVFVVVFLFGFLRLNLAPATETVETVRVAGITAQGLDEFGKSVEAISNRDPESPAMRKLVQSHWDAYFDETAREAKAGAQVIVWPEVSAVTASTDEASHIADAQEVARENGIYLALPLLTLEPGTGRWLENKLLVIDPSGAVAFEHIKYGGALMEVTRVGDGKLQSVATPFGVLSGVICYDLDYPAVIRQIGKMGAGLLLVPSKDWLEIDPIHSSMAVFRAIENGTSLVRQTDSGLSIAVDPYGRVLAQTDFFGATDRTLVAQVPVGHVPTIYSLFGSWLEWLAPIGFLYFVVRSLVGRSTARLVGRASGTAPSPPRAEDR